MKKKSGKITALIVSLCSIVNLSFAVPVAHADETLVVSDLNYTESTEYNLGYADCGYSSALWINAKPGKIWTQNPLSFSLLLIDIGGYSSGINGENIDYDLDDAFFESLEGTLINARNNGVTVGIRLRYDSNGTNNPEPATFQKVIDHIDQLGESGLLEKYEDVISYIETGLVGAWGEQWGGKYVSLQHKAQVLNEFLDIAPDSISVSVRTPNTVRQWLSDYCNISTTAADMSYEISDPELAAKAARIGLYNDGYMGSDSDLGTFSNRNGETQWLSGAAAYGGEFSGADEFRIGYSTWQPQNALPEMYLTNLMRINGNIYRSRAVTSEYSTREEAQERLDSVGELYKKMGLGGFDYAGTITEKDGKYVAGWKWMGYDDFTFNSELDSLLGVNCDNSAFYGETVWQFIRAHLGYRYVLRSAAMNTKVAPGENLNIEFSVENTGFAEAPKEKEVEIVLNNKTVTYSFTTDVNVGDWMSATLNKESVSAVLPDTISGGEWDVYLRVSDVNDDAFYDSVFCNRFANEDLQYNEQLGANYIGTLTVSGEKNEAAPEKEDKRAAGYYPVSTQPIKVDNDNLVSLLNKNYTFTSPDHFGFTFLYKISGVTEPMQLGNWYLGFNNSGSGYSSAYTTYGLNTRNHQISKDGYYALHIPFYSAVFNFSGAADANAFTLTAFNFNDSRNYWSADTYTQVNGNTNVQITPIGFVEGAPEGYNVTFHLPDGDKNYTGSYGFTDVSKQSITEKEAVTVLSLLEKAPESSYTDKDGKVYNLLGFTTKENDKSCLIDENFIAIGDIELYPYYEIDRNKTDFNVNSETLVNGMDSQGIKYILDDLTMTASVGDGSDWENNGSFYGSRSIIIPAYVVSGGKKYTVSSIGKNAFAPDVDMYEAVIPDTVREIGENAFYKGTVLYVTKTGYPAGLLENLENEVVYIDSHTLMGDVDQDASVNSADVVLLTQWLLGNEKANIYVPASDCVTDGVINVFDLVMLRSIIL